MQKSSLGNFKYHVGISSLEQVATRADKVCVLNILGSESSDVTPVGHVYSGGNVVFGTSPGRRGQILDTALGGVPVFNNVREGLEAGLRFNCGVVYLPPSGARDGVAELIRVNPDLRKIFIVTEKLSVHDSREIRALGQHNRVDIFGGNSLGVADSYQRVRIGGALGGDNPAEVLKPGSIAIFSNSGNFTTTIAAYLRMGGWGTTTLISSGKDIYIQYAAPEFAFALANDERSKAAVLYVEPGGYYELDAQFTKPVVACVVGRWKSRLARPVGHAGAMAGGDDDAAAKERWFLEKFCVHDVFTPDNPVVSKLGAVVRNIAFISAALAAVMHKNGISHDFAPEASLALKPWFGSNAGFDLPQFLDLPKVEAIAPYGAQITRLNRQIGVIHPRQSMKDVSGASQMDSQTQITSLHGISLLEAARHPMEANLLLALLREPASENDRALVNAAIAAEVNLHNRPELAAAEAARAAGNAPNVVLAAAASLVGPRRAEAARRICTMLTDRFAEAGVTDALDENFDVSLISADHEPAKWLLQATPDPRAEALINAITARRARSVFLRYLRGLGGHPTHDAVLAAIATTLAWKPLMRKRISRATAESLPWWLQLFGVLLGASVSAKEHEPTAFCGVSNEKLMSRYSLGEIGCLALLGRNKADPGCAFILDTLIGLLLSNGPGTISAQGAKGAVSADGPENPARVQLNKATIGFLTHCGYAHGGNGYEAIAFLIEQFEESSLIDPGDSNHGIDLEALAARAATNYAQYKSERIRGGGTGLQKIPGVNHPVFKEHAVNYDPRELWIHELLAGRGEYNVFHAYYRALVKALFEAGVSRVVYCVNIDAVIAALLLKMLWQPYRDGLLSKPALEAAAFTIFIYARMLGCAAEIDDHMNRGRDMDMRTAASQCKYVA